MAEKTKERKSVKNLYNAETGLSIMINLYVIKYIYYHIDKAECFIEERTAGRKPKAYPIYGNEIPMSRQRFDRINKGMSFEITANEANNIIERFGIDIRYFRKDSPDCFEIEGLGLLDWKCFYRHQYKVPYVLPESYEERTVLIKNKADSLETVLKELVAKGWETRIEKDSPLYAICYYFANGSRYDKPNNIEQFRQALSMIEYQDWDKVDYKVLIKDYEVLRKHYNYVSSLLNIYKLRNEKNKK